MKTLLYDKYLYSGFAIILILSLFIDWWRLTRTYKPMSIRSAFNLSLAWVGLAMVFGVLLALVDGKAVAIGYFSAYITEYSLSMDNIFVFVIILSYFKVSSKYYSKVLFFGILMAIVFRLIFIIAGFILINRFQWILYIFGVLLIYTAIRILLEREGSGYDPGAGRVYKFIKKNLSVSEEEGDGKMMIRRDGRRFFTRLFLVIVIIGSTDIVFAMDSIPAAFAITQHMLAIITSNIFAVIGLRAMFFMLMNAVNKFKYLQHGISFVLLFIGGKMLAEIFHVHIGTGWSLTIIATLLAGAIVLSVAVRTKKK